MSHQVDESVPPAGPSRKKWAMVAGFGVLGAALVVGILVLRPEAKATAEPKSVQVETAAVTRGDLTEQVRAQGTLAYSTSRDLGTPLTGVVTGSTRAGTIVAAGDELFRVDDVPVLLMHGVLPAWRAFESGMSDGADVAQLERNLAALGFFTLEPDDEFTSSTLTAVKAWQESVGLEPTGAIEFGRIVFTPADVRIHALKVAVGDAAGPVVITVTGASKDVRAFVEPADRGSAKVGSKMTIVLPDGAQTKGTVKAVGAPVEREGTDGPTLKVPVTITLNKPKAAATYDNVAVTVLLTQTKQKDVLLVPVAALLAQTGGGFVVEVTGKTASPRVVPVKLGAFANGLVAVTGGALAEGDTVVVAK